MTRSYERSPLPSTAAALLQLARLKAGISQGELAIRASVPATMISAYERGRRQPGLTTLLRLVHAAGLELTMRLEPLDAHDEVLASLEAGRPAQERRRRDTEVEAWRKAVQMHTPGGAGGPPSHPPLRGAARPKGDAAQNGTRDR